MEFYSQVICTVPLGCLAAIDTTQCELSYMQKMAVRTLNYDTSTKVALKFDKRWWEDGQIMNGRTIEGGSSSTDIPIRTCVYPSYGLNCGAEAPGVLLASYSWSQDAQRLGGLAQGAGTEADAILVERTLDNLSTLHGISREDMGELQDHYALTWHNDVNALGAFALFGPGQFGTPDEAHHFDSMFTSMKTPAGYGKVHFAGEATSVHHAWILGGLNSAWRAVFNAVDAGKKQELIDEWGVPDEEDPAQLPLLTKIALFMNKAA